MNSSSDDPTDEEEEQASSSSDPPEPEPEPEPAPFSFTYWSGLDCCKGWDTIPSEDDEFCLVRLSVRVLVLVLWWMEVGERMEQGLGWMPCPCPCPCPCVSSCEVELPILTYCMMDGVVDDDARIASLLDLFS